MNFTSDPHPAPARRSLRSERGRWWIHTDTLPGDALRVTLEHHSGERLAAVTIPPMEALLGLPRREDLMVSFTVTEQFADLLRPLDEAASPDVVRAALPDVPLTDAVFSEALWNALATAAWSQRPPPGTPPLTLTQLDRTVLACPSAWEGTSTTGEDVYIRYRHGGLSVTVQEEQILWMAHGDHYAGVMDDAEMMALLADVLVFPAARP